MRLIVLLPLLLLVAGCDRQKDAAPQANAAIEANTVIEANAANDAAASASAQAGKGLDRSHDGQAAPDTVFKDPDGEDVDLKEYRGAPVLLNLWATWCAPCVKELPTLDALARSHKAGGALAVVAVSQDSAPQGSVEAFLKAHAIATLGAYHDAGMNLAGAIDAQTLPTSVLYDASGHEVWRMVGDLDWNGETAKRLLAEGTRK